ncbi:MAG: CopG family transcriptional regulator [Nitrospirota bacterium]
MARLTITLPKPRHMALKEAAARRGKTIGQLIEESLDFYGITSSEHAWALVEKARARSGLNEREAMDLAVAETRRARQTTRKARRRK